MHKTSSKRPKKKMLRSTVALLVLLAMALGFVAPLVLVLIAQY